MRRLLPRPVERRVAQAYRSLFVRLDRVAAVLAPALPANARLLDIGGGDGERLNLVLRVRPDVSVVMLDIAASVGRFVKPWAQARVQRLPATPLGRHLDATPARYDAVLVSDVMHHIPRDVRGAFVGDLARALEPGAPLFVKDVEPGHPIATLGYLADRHVSGDRGVTPASMNAVRGLVAAALPGYRGRELGLLPIDRPNYLLEFTGGD